MVRSGSNLFQDLAVGWRLATAMAVAQLIGAIACVAHGWPGSVALMPEVPPRLAQVWFGAAFASPLGFALGMLWQRWSGQSAPRSLVVQFGFAALSLPVVGFALMSM